MYLSLKGSLGHTAITDRVGESLLQIAEGSSAAYSLRNLGSDSPSVVRVRRESDNAERDFTAQDINTSVVENWVNEQIIPPLDLRELTPTGRDGPLIEATAAYSLRSLSDSYTGNVVEVRRTSDDQVRSFTAAEVTDGTLLAWVNTDVDKLNLQIESGGLVGNVTNETATGFDFSVNNEGSVGNKRLLPVLNTTVGTYNATFDVVVNSGSLSGITLTRISNDNQIVAGSNSINLTLTPTTLSGAIYFRTNATAVADVSITNITLTQTSADGHVSTWYDQSGNTNHATQATAASQPKIVDAGVLVTGGIDFDGSSHFFDIDFGSNLSQPNSIFMVHQSDSVLEADNEFFDEKDTTGQRTLLDVTTAGGEQRYRMLAQNDLSTTNARVTTDKNLVVGIYNGSNSSLSLNGNVSNFTNSVGGDSIARLSAIGYSEGTNHYYDGKMDEFIIYNSDQSNNRTAFEANIGEVYSITSIPAYDNTVNGFVEAWYDQSGNGYDAVQLTASNQPKIVDAGVKVVDRDGKVAINGKGAKLDLPAAAPMLSSDGTFSVFTVCDLPDQTQGTSSFNNFLVFNSATVGGAPSTRKPQIYLNKDNGEIRASNASFPAGTAFALKAETIAAQLITNIGNPALLSANNTLYFDGALVDSEDTFTDINTDTTTGSDARLFQLEETTVETFLSEVIYYPSDESAKRVAIEDNIDNHYGITSAGSYVNAAGDSYINAAGDTYLQP